MSTPDDKANAVSAAYEDAAYVASIHAHHALWNGLLDYGWDEKTEKFGRALANAISDAIKSRARTSIIGREPCENCGPGKRTGLPGNACENCMNTGLKNPTAEDLAP